MEFIKQFDFLCFQAHFTFNQKGEIGYKTLLGGVLSLTSILTSSVFSFYFFLRLFQRKDGAVILSTERHQNINLTYTNELPFLFRLSDYAARPLDQLSIYEIYLDYWYSIPDDNEITVQKNINLTYEICDINKHFGNYKKYFKEFTDLKSYFCVNQRPTNMTIFGSYGDINPFSYLHFKFFTCGNHSNNNSCLPTEKIKTILNDAYLDLKYIDYNIESLNQKNPKQTAVKSERLPISYSVFKRIWVNFKTIRFISDNGYFFTREHEDIFHQYSNIRIDTDFRDIQDAGIKPGYFLASTFSLTGEISKFYRKYLKFQDYLATIGGIIKSITFLCQLLNYYNGKNSYYNKIINDFIIENQIKKKKSNKENNSKIIQSKQHSLIQFINNNNNIKMSQDYSMKNSGSGIQILNFSSNLHNRLKDKDKFKAKFSNSFLPYFFTSKRKDKSEMDWYIKTINNKLNIIYVLNLLEGFHLLSIAQKKGLINDLDIILNNTFVKKNQKQKNNQTIN